MTNFNNENLRDRATANQNSTNAANLANHAELMESRVQQPAAYNQAARQDGYWQGRYSEQRHEADRRAVEDESAASGVIFGLLLASLVGLGLGTYFYLTGQNRNSTPAVTTPVPSATVSPQVRERIIERDRIVPVPQQVPAPQQAPAPQVNITLPDAPAAAPAPENRVTQPAPQTNTAPTQPDATTQSGSTTQSGAQ